MVKVPVEGNLSCHVGTQLQGKMAFRKSAVTEH
jgi:hypothetical protein